MAEQKNNKQKTETLRMAPEHLFQFRCGSGVSCFTECCQDVTIVLTPYDVMRMKNALNISSGDFIEKYTIVIPKKDRLIPLVLLKMNESDKKCPLVSEKGCTIYEDRPWPCRMFPLDMGDDGSYHLITDNDKCKGLDEKDEMRIDRWLEGQQIAMYEDMNLVFSEITIPLQARKLDVDNPQITQMIFMTLYNLDQFKKFVFNSSFLDKFELEDPERIEKIKESDLHLLNFAFDWLKFGLLGEKLFWVKDKKQGS